MGFTDLDLNMKYRKYCKKHSIPLKGWEWKMMYLKPQCVFNLFESKHWLGFPGGLVINPPAHAGVIRYVGSVSGLGRCPGRHVAHSSILA